MRYYTCSKFSEDDDDYITPGLQKAKNKREAAAALLAVLQTVSTASEYFDTGTLCFNNSSFT